MKTILVCIILIFQLMACGTTGNIRIAAYFKKSTTSPWSNIGGNPGRTGYALNELSVPMQTVWTKKLSTSLGKAIVVSDSIIYTTTHDGRFYAIHSGSSKTVGYIKFIHASQAGAAIAGQKTAIGISNGKQNFITHQVFDGKFLTIKNTGAIETNPLIYDDLAYAGTLSNTAVCVDMNNGETVWSHTTSAPIHSSPTISGSAVYFGDDEGTLFSLNRFNGKLLWKLKLGGPILSAPVADDSLVYVACNDSTLYAIHQKDAVITWYYRIGYDKPGNFYASPAVDEKLLYIGATDGRLYSFEKRNGNLVWMYETKGPISIAPVISKSIVFIGSQDKSVYALNKHTGTLEWQFETEGRIKSEMAIYGGSLFVGSENNMLYKFSGKLK
ncbi:PQQ-like beta-propeller repeat protein [bacterium]|nr:PQQ-like beta-propeller repeat protein [bacterium]NUN44390.1 PQQ-like beta-propeller repeat protein [bacterium]